MRLFRLYLGMVCSCLLSACYVPSQAVFERSVNKRVHLDMSVATAQENLRKLRLVCQRQGDQLDCTRPIEGVLRTCIQRVVLMPSDPQGILKKIEVRPIACFGGFG